MNYREALKKYLGGAYGTGWQDYNDGRDESTYPYDEVLDELESLILTAKREGAEEFAEYASRFDSTVSRSYLVKEYLNTLTPQSKEEK